ncbi:MAG TPA: class I SAM-dependent methyltransferase [Candidatus Limnocylindrales bacterium]|nr:class I SAM-dependent methyltransferase [Candidatus Limnocylindrales bacterium]
MADLYDADFQRRVFDDMAASYDRVNRITSFGFSTRWRIAAVRRLELRPGMTVHDWMTGMGEGWSLLRGRLGPADPIIGIDFSAGMLNVARRRLGRSPDEAIELRGGDLLAMDPPLDDGSADAILCLFGVKTIRPDDRPRFAAELARVLRPGGTYSLIEVSTPRFAPLRWPYLFYLKRVIPILGRLLLGNPESYRLLGIYTERFGDCRALVPVLRAAGLEATYGDSFFGCASGVWGRRPA